MQQDIDRCYMSHRGSVSSMSINTLNSVWCLLPMMQHWPWTSQLVCTSETDCFPANFTTALQTNQCCLRKLTDPFHAHFEQRKSLFSWFFTIWIKPSCTCSKTLKWMRTLHEWIYSLANVSEPFLLLKIVCFEKKVRSRKYRYLL